MQFCKLLQKWEKLYLGIKKEVKNRKKYWLYKKMIRSRANVCESNQLVNFLVEDLVQAFVNDEK